MAKRFNPVDVGLDQDFVLTDFSELLKFLEGLPKPIQGGIGVGLDSCVIPTRHPGFYLVQTTDFFYPLVEDPYMQGKIACANVLSDLYAMGVTECDNMLMLLGISVKFNKKQTDIVTPLLIQGFVDACTEAGTTCNGGQTVKNPWIIIGGVASSVCQSSEFINPDQAIEGDVIVLTKPLGTQIAVNAYQWLKQLPKPKWWNFIKDAITEEQIIEGYDAAERSMVRLNKTGARLMHKYGVHAATDVTGFGILGHASNLAKAQKADVAFKIHSLPILNRMDHVASILAQNGLNFKLREGYSAETSGGLMVCLPRDKAEAFCAEIEAIDGVPAWIIGEVIIGDRTAQIIPEAAVININNSAI